MQICHLIIQSCMEKHLSMQSCSEKGFGSPAGIPARLMLLLGALYTLCCWDPFHKKGGGRFQIHGETQAYYIFVCVWFWKWVGGPRHVGPQRAI